MTLVLGAINNVTQSGGRISTRTLAPAPARTTRMRDGTVEAARYRSCPLNAARSVGSA